LKDHRIFLSDISRKTAELFGNLMLRETGQNNTGAENKVSSIDFWMQDKLCL